MRPTHIRDLNMKKTMKVLAMVLFVVGMTALTSCSKDNSELILGKWKMTKITGSVEGVTYTISIDEFLEAYGVEDAEDFIIEFKSDGMVYAGDEVSPYSINRNTLTVTEGDDVVDMTIKKLTSSKLILSFSEEDVDMSMEFQKL